MLVKLADNIVKTNAFSTGVNSNQGIQLQKWKFFLLQVLKETRN